MPSAEAARELQFFVKGKRKCKFYEIITTARTTHTLRVYREPVTPLGDHARSLQSSQQARKAGTVSLHLLRTEKPKPRSSPKIPMRCESWNLTPGLSASEAFHRCELHAHNEYTELVYNQRTEGAKTLMRQNDEKPCFFLLLLLLFSIRAHFPTFILS